MKREICFDTETTGLSPKDGDRLVEIGCVEMVDGVPTGRTYHQYINPQRYMTDEVVAVHGLTYEFLQDYPVFKEVAQSFLDFVADDSILIAHNAKFDIAFVNFELEQAGFPTITLDRFVDTLAIAKKMFPGAANTLDNLCRRFNIDLTKRSAHHGALLDAELLTDVYIELNGGKQGSIFGGENNETPILDGQESVSLQDLLRNKTKLVARDFAVDPEELEQHAEFIQTKVKGSLWFPEPKTAE